MSPVLRLNDSDDEDARYLGWAPAPGSLRLVASDPDRLHLRLRNRPASGGGQVRFCEGASGTVWVSELSIRLERSRPSVDFQVAGAVASIDDGDAAIEIVNEPSNTVLLTVPLMVRVRKNAERLTDSERARFLSALATLNDAGRGEYQTFRNVHVAESDAEMHRGPAFLPWHRAYLLDLERELQRICASVTIPYWRFDQAAPTVFSPQFMGSSDEHGNVVFSSTNPLTHWVVDSKPGVDRAAALWDPTTEGARGVPQESVTLRVAPVFDTFRKMQATSHDKAHVSFAFSIGLLETAVRDPLFFLLHANVDRLWAIWQQQNGLHRPSDAGTYTQTRTPVGHGRSESMWPWNGIVHTPRPPFAPGGTMASSSVVTAPGASPRVSDMLDYQGVSSPSRRLGFDYDDVPYEGTEGVRRERLDHQPMSESPLNDIAVLPISSLLDTLMDGQRSMPERWEALNRLQTQALDDPSVQSALIDLVGPSAEASELRAAGLQALRMAEMSSRVFDETRPAYLALLRDLIKDNEAPLRETAIELLGMMKDPVGQEQLLAELRQPQASAVPLARVIQLLSYDPHGEHLPFCREAAKTAADPQLRLQAIRALAADPQSAGFLREVFASRQEPTGMRIAAAISLRALDPREFADVARAVLASDSEEPELRTMCDVAFKHSPTLANL